MKTQTKQLTQAQQLVVEMFTKQAQAILEVEENRELIDNPLKLLIGSMLLLSRDFPEFKELLIEATKQ